MECKCKTTYSSTMYNIIVKIRSNTHLAIKDSLDTKFSKICAKCKQSKSHKLKQTFLNPQKLLMVIINRFNNNNRQLNNVLCITESIHIDSYKDNNKSMYSTLWNYL